MSRFEMSASKPEEIQFELRAAMTLKEWREIVAEMNKDAIFGAPGHLRDAITSMIRQASQTYRYYPEEEPK